MEVSETVRGRERVRLKVRARFMRVSRRDAPPLRWSCYSAPAVIVASPVAASRHVASRCRIGLAPDACAATIVRATLRQNA